MPILNKVTKLEWLFNLCTARKPTMNRTARFRYLFIPYLVLLSYLLLAPDPFFFLPDGDQSLKNSVHETLPDYIYHATAWGLFTVLFTLSTNNSTSIVLLFTTAYSTTLEFAQPLFGRITELSDFAANIIGIILAIGFIKLPPAANNTTSLAKDPE